MGAPCQVRPEQLQELSIAIVRPPEDDPESPEGESA